LFSSHRLITNRLYHGSARQRNEKHQLNVASMMVEIFRPLDCAQDMLEVQLRSVMPVQTGIQVTDSVRHTVGKRYPG
jgi:hypothetical protein